MADLRVEGLCKGWDFPVIDELSFGVDEGEFFVVVGPSGIGKTTLLRLVAGLESPDAGRVLVGGDDVTATPPYRRRVAMTFESYALYPHLSVFDNIASPLKARGVERAEIGRRVDEVAKLLRIDTLLERKPGEVSGGQKQRTALGRTLVADPSVFLLDEPLSHLDAKIRHELRTQFHTLEALRRVAALYVTHDYAEALSLGDRIGVMGQGGRLVQIGSPRELFERPHHVFVAEHLGQPSINLIDAELETENGTLWVRPTGATMSGASSSGDAGAAGASVTRRAPSIRTIRLPVAAAHRARVEANAGTRVTVGLRPQHLRPADESAGGVPLEASVDVFEPLGSTGIMLADAGGLTLTALTHPERTFEAASPVTLHVDNEALFYFDAASGRNLLLD